MKILLLLLFVPALTYSQNYVGDKNEIESILVASKAFSRYYMEADYDAMANSYTEDGKIFPSGTLIIEGKEAIRERWVLPEGSRILHHKATPSEIQVIGDVANDFGYYEGKTQRADGSTFTWKGKYVIVWKKVDSGWKMYLDIWNRVNE